MASARPWRCVRAATIPVALMYAVACGTNEEPAPRREIRPAETMLRLDSVVAASGAEVGIYYRSLAPGGDSITVDADVRMHAASTMKVPVMMRLFLDDQEGIRSLDETMSVTRTFRSIVDGSLFDLPPDSDSDTTFYGQVGQEATIRSMVDRMITWSSNLATNILIEVAEPDRIASMLSQIGADSMTVLRGVEDLKAFEAGLSNSTTARGLGAVMAGIVESDLFTDDSRAQMLEILSRQHFTDGIPAGIPGGVRVANKTGWITGINHDAAIVFPEGLPGYVLVVMVRGHPEEDQGESLTAEISRIIWALHAQSSSP
ncbi:MAG: class A beta-lactamase-related serine hydrolase [Gemmatimonadota bacterium]|nr:class A beta-lactamase-related serine hydrolase [Gemmatimonadota bacterium]